MEANSWLLVASVAFLIFCCLPMLFMGRHKEHSKHTEKENGVDKAS